MVLKTVIRLDCVCSNHYRCIKPLKRLILTDLKEVNMASDQMCVHVLNCQHLLSLSNIDYSRGQKF